MGIIDREPVIPVALARMVRQAVRSRWRAARDCFAGFRSCAAFGCHADRGERFVVRIGPAAIAAKLSLELLGSDGRPLLRACRRPAPAGPVGTSPTAVDAARALVRRDLDQRTLHVRAFICGTSKFIRTASSSVAAFAIRRSPAAGCWTRLLDGGLQLALLWTRRLSGGLPSHSDGAVHLDATGSARGQRRCILEDGETKSDSASVDLIFVDGDGRSLAELRGVVTHLLPESARDGRPALVGEPQLGA